MSFTGYLRAGEDGKDEVARRRVGGGPITNADGVRRARDLAARKALKDNAPEAGRSSREQRVYPIVANVEGDMP